MSGYGNVSNGGYGNPEGDSNALKSMIMAIVGVFFLPLVLGPLAIYYANRATPGTQATVGKVLGWIDVVWGILSALLIIASIALPALLSARQAAVGG